jgi:hypothetical protein
MVGKDVHYLPTMDKQSALSRNSFEFQIDNGGLIDRDRHYIAPLDATLNGRPRVLTSGHMS